VSRMEGFSAKKCSPWIDFNTGMPVLVPKLLPELGPEMHPTASTLRSTLLDREMALSAAMAKLLRESTRTRKTGPSCN